VPTLRSGKVWQIWRFTIFLSILLPLSQNLTPSLSYHIVRKGIGKVTDFLSFCPFEISIFPFLTIRISMYQKRILPYFIIPYLFTPSWFPFGAFRTDRQTDRQLLQHPFHPYVRRADLTCWAPILVKNLTLIVLVQSYLFIAFLDRSCCPAPPGKLFFNFSNFWLTYGQSKKFQEWGKIPMPESIWALASPNKNVKLLFSTKVYVILRQVAYLPTLPTNYVLRRIRIFL